MSRASIALVVLALCMMSAVLHAAQLTINVPAARDDRRFIVVEQLIPANRLQPPFNVINGASHQPVPIQTQHTADGEVVRFMIPSLAAGQSASFTIEPGRNQSPALMRVTPKDGYLSISDPAREITRYNFGPQFAKFKKPFLWPVMVAGVNPIRDWPMSTDRANEPHDHPHHTGVYFAYGEVNGREYWSKLPITHAKFLATESGEVFARIGAENHWGQDLIELQDIRIYNVGADAVLMDWTITLKTPGDKPVHLGQSKEGGFAVRVTDGISFNDEKADAPDNMVDSQGHHGEKAIRNENAKLKTRLHGPSASWADDFGVVDGKTVGVAIMNHPTSFRYPGDWHVRAYGLFAASPFFLQGPYTIQPDAPITLKYRLYFHAGKPDEAHVADVFQGYASNASELK